MTRIESDPRHHSAPERFTVARFDDEARVIALQRMVHQTKPGPRAARAEAALDLMDDARGAQ